MRIIRPFYLLILLSCFSQRLSGQDDGMIPPAPEPAKLAQFALTPTGPYTGSQNFSVPLHTIDFDGMPINLSLSYRSGGIRASEDAGEIGLGWGLNYTGTISRVIQGGDDLLTGENLDIGYPSSSVNHLGRIGYVYDGKEVPQLSNNWADPSYSNFFYSEEAASILASSRDTEPDIFSLSFFGTSSKFVLSKLDPVTQKVEVIKLSADPNKITFDPVAQTFTVITPEGFKGKFDIKSFSTSISSSGDNRTIACGSRGIDFYWGILIGGKFRRITTWYLSQITSPSGRKLDFNYSGVDKSQANQDIFISMSANSFGERRAVLHSANSPQEGPVSCSKSMQEHIYPASITSPELGINITFQTASRADLRLPDFSDSGNEYQWAVFGNFYKTQIDLGNIKAPKRVTGFSVTCDDQNSNLNRNIVFDNEGYFNEDMVPAPAPEDEPQYFRLRLDKVVVDDQVYRFDYYNGLPAKSSTGTDYWGFYNGQNDQQELLPAFVNPIAMCGQVFGASFYAQHPSRMANFEFGKAGLMYKVTYPTGGATEYEYESHDYQITEEEFPYEGNPSVSVGASQGDATSIRELSYIGYFQHPEPGSTCIAPVMLDITLSYYNFWTPSSCCTDVLGDHLHDDAVELIDATTGEVLQSFAPWSLLKNNADDPNDLDPNVYRFRKTISLELKRGIYKIRSKRKVNSDGATIYYADATLTVPTVCSQQEYSEFVVKTINAGGARIKSLTNYDEYGKATTRKSYKYQKHEFGQVFSSGVLMTPIRNVYISDKDNPNNAVNFASCAYMITSASAIPLSSAAQGGHIGYSRVEEFVENGLGTKNLGRTVYEYENIPNEIIQAQASVSNSNVNGQLKRQTVYDNEFPIANKVKRTEYDELVDELGEVKALKYTALPVVIEGYAVPTFQYGTSYTLKSQFVTPKKVTTTDYYENGKVSQTVDYEYNADFLLRKEIKTRSDGKPIEVEYKRPSDYTSQSLALQKMIEKNQLAVVETITKVDGKVVQANGLHYVYDAANDLILINEELAFNEDRGVFTGSVSGDSFDGGYEANKFYKHDANGNVLEILNRAGVGTVYLWGYNKTLPVAEIKNATWTAVKNSLGQSAIDALEGPPDVSQINQLKADIPGILITTMTHSQQVGLTSITTPEGKKMVYIYDTYGRLSAIEDGAGNVLKYFKYQYKEIDN